MLTTIHTFADNDPRARLTFSGQPYRAVRIDRDENGELSVWVRRVTKATGADFKSENSFMWLTLEHSLERFPASGGTDLAAYVREIAAQAPGMISNYGTRGYEIRLGDGRHTEVRYYVDYVPGHGWIWWGIYGDMGGMTDDTLHNTRVLSTAGEAIGEALESYAARLGLSERPSADPEIDCMCTPCMQIRERA